MSGGVSFDFSEINDLAADIGKGMRVVPEKIAAHVAETAQKVQKDWQEPLKGSEYLPGGAGSVTWEIKGSASAILGRSAISAEVGPVLRGQGPLVGMLEYGTPNTGARGFGAAALKANESGFRQGVIDATEAML